MNLNMKIAGALTLGLAGNVEMSLWSRNSNTDVINRYYNSAKCKHYTGSLLQFVLIFHGKKTFLKSQ